MNIMSSSSVSGEKRECTLPVPRLDGLLPYPPELHGRVLMKPDDIFMSL